MPDGNPLRRKRIRLDPRLYADTTTTCLITICTADRTPAFSGNALAAGCVAVLISVAHETGFQLHAFCLMPDHVHLLMSPSPTASILDFVRDFKGLTTRYAWTCGHVVNLWQPSFHDHFVRREEDVERTVMYILNNPVRKGLATEWRQYPY
ncbi:MAG TPA: transposase, partial [Chloroflexota bacterium]|nr:transposase [Chloroflexota bacterium]